MSKIPGPKSTVTRPRPLFTTTTSTTTSDTDSNQDLLSDCSDLDEDLEDLQLPQHYPLIDSPLSGQSISRPLDLAQSASLSLTLRLYLIMSLLLMTVLFALISALIDQSPTRANSDDADHDPESSHNWTQSTPFVRAFHLNLDPSSHYRLFWTVDYDDESVLFELSFRQSSSLDWFGIGFSDYGAISNADLCLFWFDQRGKLHFDDIKTDKQSFVMLDQQSNDCRLIRARRKGRNIVFSYRRSFDTCDPDDYLIDDGTTHVVYATGQGPLARVEALRLSDHRHGLQRARLLKPMQELSKLPSTTRLLSATNLNATIPVRETVYWCRLIQLPDQFRNKTHVVQYEAAIQPENEGQVHHMEVFHCEVDPTEQLPIWDGDCLDPSMPPILKACKRVIAAWAFGAGPLTYPAHVGLPVGGANNSLYVMLEVHFNNPELRPIYPDNSGILLYYSDRLRPIDAGILEVGLEYSAKNSIPPGVVMLQHGYCVSECTRAALPPYGITVFASQLHTHLTGVSVWTRHVRGGIELPELNRDQHYSQHFQEIRQLKRPVTVFPGDALINVCRYDTRNREQITLGGLSISDEMCVNYMHYYPKTDLEVCKSSIDTDHLNRYFDYMATQEGQNTSIRYSVEDNLKNIHWNGARAAALAQLYQTAPLSMQCNKSSGERFPGYWNGIPLTQILSPWKAEPSQKCRLAGQRPNSLLNQPFDDLQPEQEFMGPENEPPKNHPLINQLEPLPQHHHNHQHQHQDLELHMQDRNIFDSSGPDSSHSAATGGHNTKLHDSILSEQAELSQHTERKRRINLLANELRTETDLDRQNWKLSKPESDRSIVEDIRRGDSQNVENRFEM